MRGGIVAAILAGTVVAAGAASLIGLGVRGTPAVQGRISPHESTSADVAGAHLRIVYGRPSMRGRRIFGALVPFGRVWCPGADEATTIETSRPIRLGGTLDVPTGPHTVWMLPQPSRWTFIVSQEPEGFHTRYSPSLDLGRVPLRLRTLDAPVEQLTFTIARKPAGGGTIAMKWEKTEVSVDFTVAK